MRVDHVQKGKAGWQVQRQASGLNTRTDSSLGNGNTVPLCQAMIIIMI